MELYYTLINVYSPNKAKEDRATQILEDFIETEYVEEKEVIETAIENDSVILIEVEQDDGYSETILVNNLGQVKKRDIFSLEKVEEIRKKIEEVTIQKYFTKKAMKIIDEHRKEHDISLEECVDEYLFEILLEDYENGKGKYSETLQKYYKK